jgi:hypothetical protein
MEPEEPQDAQVILGDPGSRVAHEPHAARQQVGQAAQRSITSPAGVAIKRVHREIAPRGILGHVGGKGHTAWRPKVSTSRRKVVTSCAMPPAITVTVPCSSPVGTSPKTGFFGNVRHVFGRGIGGDVHIIHRTPSSALRTQPPTNSARNPPPPAPRTGPACRDAEPSRPRSSWPQPFGQAPQDARGGAPDVIGAVGHRIIAPPFAAPAPPFDPVVGGVSTCASGTEKTSSTSPASGTGGEGPRRCASTGVTESP